MLGAFFVLHSSLLLLPIPSNEGREQLTLSNARTESMMSEGAGTRHAAVHLVVRASSHPSNISDRNSRVLVHSDSGNAFITKAAPIDSDHREHAVEVLRKDIGIESFAEECLERLFAFQSSREEGKKIIERTNVVFEYHIKEDEHRVELEKMRSFRLVPTNELRDQVNQVANEHSVHHLYLQRHQDRIANRRLLHGYSGSDLDQYCLRPKPSVVFFDCDDCLYFDNWTTANRLTKKIDEWCINHGLPAGKAYELYKQYGTALRGLRAEGYLEDTDSAVDKFLEDVHDISVDTMLRPDPALRDMILRMDPSIPRYIFTASVRHHAERCLRALGVDDLFVDIIDCKRCDLETKHSLHSFRAAMKVANVEDPEKCLFLDDSTKNLQAAREIGWRSVLVGTVGRDCGSKVRSDHAELEIDRIHEMEQVLPELFHSGSTEA